MSADLQFMGSNLIDLYFGALGVEEICRQCVNLVNDGVARWHEEEGSGDGPFLPGAEAAHGAAALFRDVKKEQGEEPGLHQERERHAEETGGHGEAVRPGEGVCRDGAGISGRETNLTLKAFKQWLSPYAYRKVALSDGSWWIIKAGNDPERFIHIHPAKYSPATVRIRAATLKTLVAMKIFMRDTRDPQCEWAMELTDKVFRVTKAESDCLQLGEVNRVRVHLLGLSPIKAIEWGRGIARLWPLFQNG